MTEAREKRLTVELLSAVLSEAGVCLPPEATEKLLLHTEEMLVWNRSIRLTAITDPWEIAVKHILDSLLLLAFSPFPGRTLDFGSGAGYPGIPLAVALPGAHLVLLESSAKKCAFLSRVCARLSIRNAEVVRGRLERRSQLQLGRFEQIVTRATLPPREAGKVLVPFLAPGGRLLLMTAPGEGGLHGKKSDGDANTRETSFPPGVEYGRRERFVLPRGMGSREIREVRVHATASRFS